MQKLIQMLCLFQFRLLKDKELTSERAISVNKGLKHQFSFMILMVYVHKWGLSFKIQAKIELLLLLFGSRKTLEIYLLLLWTISSIKLIISVSLV